MQDSNTERQVDQRSQLREETPRSIPLHELAAFATHEFRGPIHSLQAFLSIMLGEQSGPLNDIQRDFVSSMLFITRRLERLTDDIQIMVADGDGVSIERRPVDVLALVQDCQREVLPIADGFNVQVELSTSRNTDWEHLADPVRFAQIIINLLENAVRNSHDGSTVRLCLRQSVTRLLIVVENEAIDSPNGHVNEWFTPFVRGQSAAARAPMGSGLGLAIVSHLVDALDGRIITRMRGRSFTIAIQLPRIRVGYVQS